MASLAVHRHHPLAPQGPRIEQLALGWVWAPLPGPPVRYHPISGDMHGPSLQCFTQQIEDDFVSGCQFRMAPHPPRHLGHSSHEGWAQFVHGWGHLPVAFSICWASCPPCRRAKCNAIARDHFSNYACLSQNGHRKQKSKTIKTIKHLPKNSKNKYQCMNL